MSRGTAYYDLPNGERIELPTTMPDVEEVPGPLCDGKFELPEAVREMFKWMDETFGTWESDFSSFKIWMKLRKNFNPPVRWEAMQDKRRNPKPLGRNTYLYKARKIKSLARSTHTRVSLHKGKQKGTEEQCKHTFKITAARCAPCSGYNVECEHYEKNSAADTQHGSSRTCNKQPCTAESGLLFICRRALLIGGSAANGVRPRLRLGCFP